MYHCLSIILCFCAFFYVFLCIDKIDNYDAIIKAIVQYMDNDTIQIYESYDDTHELVLIYGKETQISRYFFAQKGNSLQGLCKHLKSLLLKTRKNDNIEIGIFLK